MISLPLILGAAAVGGGFLLLRKKKIPADVLAASQAQLSPAQQAALKQPLAPAVQQVLATRGPDPTASTIASLKIEQAAGTLDVANLLKGTDGTVFVKQGPVTAPLSNDILSQIEATDRLTVDILRAGIQIPAIGSGNMLMSAASPPDMVRRLIQAQVIDPRVPDNAGVINVPLDAITGISPQGT